jgi:hypothetical protein
VFDRREGFGRDSGSHALAARNADGSCSQERAPLAEVDAITLTGTLSF